ncbi:putative lipoprotein [Bacterioplanes sanyensis]|uniref:hypothetical protein n=1 Tax=Bacterioplanes sanyensis TaxID=1249553 RepID=UPI0019ABC994|nr:hypothetical protein [Bacterioplanes sanyensis]GGY36727.1 putative lipoprotein [Bacterioplanes sanyensis]
MNKSIWLLAAALLSGCFNGQEDNPQQASTEVPDNTSSVADNNLEYGSLIDLSHDVSHNPVAYIPPQCYTDPVTEQGAQNPCYVCHTDSKRPNFLNDTDVQQTYTFPEPGLKNYWSNLFKDRREAVAAISDDAILNYVRQDNYKDKHGQITLAQKLHQLPAEWDRNGNGEWDGYVPDVYFNFDEEGFDRAPDGSLTGWRVYAYYPFPGTFMPTNGSTDDVMMRLPEPFRQNRDGEFDKEIYKLNLAIAEAIAREKDVPFGPVDESKVGVDLNKDGVLSISSVIRYDWAPLENRHMYYVGLAGELQKAGEVKAAARLLPVGTEFAHSVRYLDVTENGTAMAQRMKEFRYGKKSFWRNYHQLRTIVDNEVKERHDFPDRTKQVTGNAEEGLTLAHGWTYQGFIEDDKGQLRPQTYEETYFCAGCHGGMGASNDTIVSLERKFDHGTFRDGWYHWLEKGLQGIADPKREDGQGEYAFYLQNNPTGNEYRNNMEVLNTFFHSDMSPKTQAFAQLETDISLLLMPSPQRALQLNKAYQLVVKEQSFAEGRDAVLAPLTTVHKQVELDGSTGIDNVLSYY